MKELDLEDQDLYRHFTTCCGVSNETNEKGERLEAIDAGFEFIIIDTIAKINLHRTARIAYQQLDEQLNMKERFWIAQCNEMRTGLNGTKDWNNTGMNRRNYSDKRRLSKRLRKYWTDYWSGNIDYIEYAPTQ